MQLQGQARTLHRYIRTSRCAERERVYKSRPQANGHYDPQDRRADGGVFGRLCGAEFA